MKLFSTLGKYIFIGVLAIVVIIIAQFTGAVIGRNAAEKYASEDTGAAALQETVTGESLTSDLFNVAVATTKHAPRMISAHLRLDGAKVIEQKNEIILFMSVTIPFPDDIDLPRLKEELKQEAIEMACKDARQTRPLLDRGASITYEYRDSENVQFATAKVTKRQCAMSP